MTQPKVSALARYKLGGFSVERLMWRSSSGTNHGLHPTIAVDGETGALLGLVHAELLARDGSAAKVHCNKRPFAEKESRR